MKAILIILSLLSIVATFWGSSTEIPRFGSETPRCNIDNYKHFKILFTTKGCNLRGADLRGVDFQEAAMWRWDLRGADLRGANLRSALLWGADLRGVELEEADLEDADFTDAIVDPKLARYLKLQGISGFIVWE